jgi:hypothetical protein
MEMAEQKKDAPRSQAKPAEKKPAGSKAKPAAKPAAGSPKPKSK